MISYNMPTCKLHCRPVLYFAGWKKGTIRFPLSEPIPVHLIEAIAKLRARVILAAPWHAAAGLPACDVVKDSIVTVFDRQLRLSGKETSGDGTAALGKPEVADVRIISGDGGAPGQQGRACRGNPLYSNKSPIALIYPGVSVQQMQALRAGRQFEFVTSSARYNRLAGQANGVVLRIDQHILSGFSPAHLAFFP